MQDIMNIDREIIEKNRRPHQNEKDKCDNHRKYECEENYNHHHEHGHKCSCKKSICKVIESIADEEMAIAAILKAESEKIKKAVHISCDIKELVIVNESVGDTLKEVIKLQILLQYKLEEANKALK